MSYTLGSMIDIVTNCSLYLKGSIPEEAPQPVAVPERQAAVPATQPTGQPAATSGQPVTQAGSSG